MTPPAEWDGRPRRAEDSNILERLAALEGCHADCESTIQSVIEQTIDKSIEKFWLSMGVDVSDPAGVLEFQADFRHIRYMRQLSGKVGTRALNIALSLTIGGALVVVLQKLGLPVEKLLH